MAVQGCFSRISTLGAIWFLGWLSCSGLPARSEELTTSASLPPPADAAVGARMDPKHPFKIGEKFYRVSKDGTRHSGSCDLALQVEPDGSMYAMQLLVSTGHPELDAACIEAVNGVNLLPGTVNGRPTRSWYPFKINWRADWNTPTPSRDLPRTPRRKLDDYMEPHIRPDYMLHVGPSFYPNSARDRKEAGFCLINILIDHAGNKLDTRLSKSTGFDDLDLACINAASRAEFASLGDDVKSAWASVVIFWRPD
jgi:TonB family protein